jgi:hypothetical protein
MELASIVPSKRGQAQERSFRGAGWRPAPSLLTGLLWQDYGAQHLQLNAERGIDLLLDVL